MVCGFKGKPQVKPLVVGGERTPPLPAPPPLRENQNTPCGLRGSLDSVCLFWGLWLHSVAMSQRKGRPTSRSEASDEVFGALDGQFSGLHPGKLTCLTQSTSHQDKEDLRCGSQRPSSFRLVPSPKRWKLRLFLPLQPWVRALSWSNPVASVGLPASSCDGSTKNPPRLCLRTEYESCFWVLRSWGRGRPRKGERKFRGRYVLSWAEVLLVYHTCTENKLGCLSCGCLCINYCLCTELRTRP